MVTESSFLVSWLRGRTRFTGGRVDTCLDRALLYYTKQQTDHGARGLQTRTAVILAQLLCEAYSYVGFVVYEKGNRRSLVTASRGRLLLNTFLITLWAQFMVIVSQKGGLSRVSQCSVLPS